MVKLRNYLDDARKEEEVFRNLLRSLPEKVRKSQGIDPDEPLEKIFEKYSSGNRHGKWTILDFRRGPYDDPLTPLKEDEIFLASEDVAILSGRGRIDRYKVENDSTIFDSNIAAWMS